MVIIPAGHLRGFFVKRIIIIATFALIGLAGLFAVLGAMFKPVEVTTETVRIGPAVETVYATGYVEARERRILRAPRAAVIEEVYPDQYATKPRALREGDAVTQNQPILRLRDSALSARRRAAEAEVQRLTVELADGSPLRATWEAQISQAETTQKDDADRAARLEKQVASGTVTRDTADAANARAKVSASALAGLRQSYAKAIADLKAALTAATSELETVQAAEADNIIRAPLDGVLLRLPLKQGEFAPAGTELALVGDIRELIIEAEVNEDDIHGVTEGKAVLIRLAGHDERPVRGKVYEILPDADRTTKGYTVRVTFEAANAFVAAPGSKLQGRTVLEDGVSPYSGMTAELGIEVRAQSAVLVFPRTALTPDNTVFVVRDGKAFETRVTLGLTNFRSCEAKSGLSDGDVVVTGGVNQLSDGARVRDTGAK